MGSNTGNYSCGPTWACAPSRPGETGALAPVPVWMGIASRSGERERVVRMYRDIPVELGRLIEPVVEAAGLEVVDVVVTRGRPPWLLRVIIDTPEGDGRVAIEVCADVSREIETHLDAEDAVASRYNLEVSSPGLNRVLAREKDFLFARGSEVRIETRQPLEGRKRFRGRLEDFDGETAGLLVDGVRMQIPFADVARANAVYDFSAADFVSEAGRK